MRNFVSLKLYLEGLRKIRVAGVASVFATIDTVQGLPVRACFNPKDLPDYASHAAHECPQCKAGVKLDALVNSFGYSKL